MTEWAKLTSLKKTWLMFIKKSNKTQDYYRDKFDNIIEIKATVIQRIDDHSQMLGDEMRFRENRDINYQNE